MTLTEFFKKHNRCAIALSGGADSALLLYAAKEVGADVKAYYVQSQFQPHFELDDATRLCDETNVPLKVLTADTLADPTIAKNDACRCYFCKKLIMTEIAKAAACDGYPFVADGSNMSDNPDERPGMRVLGELNIISPLRECNLDKTAVRAMLKSYGCALWDKPSYSCLATRISRDEEITQDKLSAVDAAETALFEMGFSDFRVRLKKDCATLIINKKDVGLLHENTADILYKTKRLFTRFEISDLMRD